MPREAHIERQVQWKTILQENGCNARLEKSIKIKGARVVVDVFVEFGGITYLIEIGDIDDERKNALLQIYAQHNSKINFIHEAYGQDKTQEVLSNLSSYKAEPFISAENSFPISNKEDIINKLLDFLRKDLIGFNRNNITINDVSIILIPVYMINFSIYAIFSTSVGVIHSIDLTGPHFFSKDGNTVNPFFIEPISQLVNKITTLDSKNFKEIKIRQKETFTRTKEEIEILVRCELKKMFTKKVTYYGNNNHRYTKICTPNDKNILIKNVKRVYIPIWTFIFSILKNKYILSVQETSTIKIIPKNLAVTELTTSARYPDYCMICQKLLMTKKFVCSECGIITCESNSSECEICGKVICQNHTISKRKYLVMTSKYCEHCAKTIND